MSNQEKLKELLTEEFIPDLEEFIDDIFTAIAEKKDDGNLQEELDESQEVLKSFKDVVKDIDNNELEDEECDEILAELEDIKKEYATQEE